MALLFRRALAAPLAGFGALLVVEALVQAPAQAHHLLHLTGLKPSPITGLLSGLAHPWIGPDHLLFLLALSLVGLLHRRRWMLGLLATGLTGSVLGLVFPGLPAMELLTALTLVAEALVLLQGWSPALLLPLIAVHGYVLSASVLGWSSTPLAFYLLGLILSQGALLLLALTVMRRLTSSLAPQVRQGLALALIGFGAAFSLLALQG